MSLMALYDFWIFVGVCVNLFSASCFTHTFCFLLNFPCVNQIHTASMQCHPSMSRNLFFTLHSPFLQDAVPRFPVLPPSSASSLPPSAVCPGGACASCGSRPAQRK